MFVSLKIPIAMVFVCFFLGSFLQDEEDKLPPQELRGKGFDPGDRKFWRGGLADWDQMSELAGVDMTGEEAEPENFVKVRIFGFREYNNGKNIDKIVTDKLDLEFLRKSIHPSLCRRELISDFTNVWGSAGFGAYLGVIQISTETENYIIGVSHTGLVWGEFIGSPQQTFYSWPLAKLVDLWLYETTGKRMKAELFSLLSGEDVIEKGKNEFQEYLKKKEQKENSQ